LDGDGGGGTRCSGGVVVRVLVRRVSRDSFLADEIAFRGTKNP